MIEDIAPQNGLLILAVSDDTNARQNNIANAEAHDENIHRYFDADNPLHRYRAYIFGVKLLQKPLWKH